MYGACFGIELTIDNIAALYFTDSFHLSLKMAGLVASSFGINYLFERRSLRLFLINGGYHTLQFTLYGLVLGLWH